MIDVIRQTTGASRSVAGKVFSAIINRRIMDWVESSGGLVDETGRVQTEERLSRPTLLDNRDSQE